MYDIFQNHYSYYEVEILNYSERQLRRDLMVK